MKSLSRLNHRFLSGALLTLAIFLSIWRSFTPDIVRIKEAAFDINATVEASLWCIVVFGLGYSMWATHSLPTTILRIRKNWILLIFLALALISITWSIAPVISVYRVIAVIGSTLVGITLGSTRDDNKVLDAIFWSGAAILILSYVLVLVFPWLGRMYARPYSGAWCGLFWHKNHLGILMSFFAMIYLFRALRNIKYHIPILDIIFYILSAGLVYLSRSAAAYISFISLHIALITALIWVRIQSRLRRLHYILMGIVGGIIALMLFFNLNRFFGLFNRSADLTGRTQLWQYLLGEVVTQKPVFGHGFGAIWYLESFRTHVQSVVGWPYPVKIGDNGFVDILLHLGGVGLSIFVTLFLIMSYRAIRYVLSKRTFVSFLPLLILFYSLIGNISFSLFFEIETYVWILMVAAFFLASDQGLSTTLKILTPGLSKAN